MGVDYTTVLARQHSPASLPVLVLYRVISDNQICRPYCLARRGTLRFLSHVLDAASLRTSDFLCVVEAASRSARSSRRLGNFGIVR